MRRQVMSSLTLRTRAPTPNQVRARGAWSHRVSRKKRVGPDAVLVGDSRRRVNQCSVSVIQSRPL